MPTLKGEFTAKEAWEVFYKLQSKLINLSGIIRIDIAGSLRRLKNVVGDVDVVITVDLGTERSVMCNIGEALQQGVGNSSKKATVVIDGVPVDINLTTRKLWPYAMMHHTGSKEENIRLRRLAKKRGWILSQNGICHRGTKKLVMSDVTSESDVYKLLGVSWRSPEYR